ncbi:hypothetical protein SY88_13070 [Clostridiales bacterium PH28_bin88]|nr:hypothetical protein SY88_13070 [Clostridiales bacterium PH28_bin88]
MRQLFLFLKRTREVVVSYMRGKPDFVSCYAFGRAGQGRSKTAQVVELDTGQKVVICIRFIVGPRKLIRFGQLFLFKIIYYPGRNPGLKRRIQKQKNKT